MTTFADRLRYAMGIVGVNQSALAEKVGVSKAAISQYLSGKNIPGIVRLQALADAVGVSFDYLAGFEATANGASPVMKKISKKGGNQYE